MFGKILFCTDFSEHATAAFHCIRKLPGLHSMILLHAVDATHSGKRGWTYDPEIENARLILDELKLETDSAGITGKARLEVITGGDIPGAILGIAAQEDPDLIVMGARGRGLVQGLLFGSVSSSVLRHSRHDVLIYREKAGGRPCPDILSKVLFPTDFSPPAEAALKELGELPGVGTVALLHVVTRGETHDEIQASVAEAKDGLREISEQMGSGDMKMTTHVRIGNPVEEILRVAMEEEAGLIFMSSHGENMVQTIFLGSTTGEVVRSAGCPVLVARAKHKS
ncbi:MAG: universal stress protein [Methanoregulaceae archaeon]|nr:universal stress protein [Methanoregulaceae archaeon]